MERLKASALALMGYVLPFEGPSIAEVVKPQLINNDNTRYQALLPNALPHSIFRLDEVSWASIQQIQRNHLIMLLTFSHPDVALRFNSPTRGMNVPLSIQN
jgi:hypothetical protein